MLSVRSLTVFEENIVVTVLAKLVPLIFQQCTCAFFSLRIKSTGVRLREILVNIMFQSLFGSLLNHLHHYTNENVSVKHLP